MEKEKKLSICSKFISALIIVMVIISSYGTFLSEVAAAVSEYENQKTEAGDRKVNFDAYLKNGEDKVHMAEVNTKDENYLYFNISLQEGIVQNAKITLNNPNFAINYEELKSNTLIKSVNETENSIELNQISENVEIPVKISYKAGDKVNLTDLERDTEITLEGTYTDSQKSNKNISGNIAVRLKWISSVEGALQTNIENYIEADGKSIVITNTLGTINNITVPMEYVEFSSNVPEINGTIPEEIDITENGKKLSENEFTYDKENKTLVIRKENTSNENNEINNLLGNINYDVIYVYGSQFNLDKVNIGVKQNLKVKPYNLNETNISFENNLEKEKTNQTTKVDISSAENISKGYMYWQKYETPYDVNMNVQIQYILPNRNIEITEKENTLVGDETNLNITNKTSYTRTAISKAEVTEILGDNGSLEIYDENTGNLIITINKDTQADENGNIVINYENVSRIKIVIKDPAKIGNIHINSSKKIISNHGISNDELKAINQLKLVFETNNMIYSNTTEKNINLYNTVTKSTMEIDKTEFYTTDNESKINMKINLNTQNMDYDLYKNPVLQVIFPSEFETVNIEQIGMSFENGLRLQSSNMVNNPDGTKTLTIYVTGEQQEYLNNDITANTQISISGTVKTYQDLTSRDTNIIYVYTNEKAITYDNNGTYNVPIKITAPYGFVMQTEVNGTTSKNKELKEVKLRANTVEQTIHVKETVVNNFDNTVNNFELVGMTPIEDRQYTLGENSINSNFNGEIVGNVYINRDDAKIYYSEDNENWSETKTENSNLFKISFDNSNLNKGDTVTIEYDLKIPENISYSKSSYVAFIANAKQNENEVNNWSGIKVSTEDMQLNEADPEASTVDESEIKTEISVVKGNVSLQAGEDVHDEQNLKYIIKLTNTTDKTINNIKLTATNTNAVFYEFMTKQVTEDLVNQGFYEVPNKKEQEFTIESLGAGEEVELNYQVIVKKAGDNSSTQATIKIAADSISEKEIKSIENPIKDAKLQILLDPGTTTGYPDSLTEDGAAIFGMKIKNLSNEDINDLVVSFYYTKNVVITEQILDSTPTNNAEILENKDNTLKYTVKSIPAGQTVVIYTYALFNPLEDGLKTNTFYTFCNALYNDEEYLSGQLDFTVNKSLTTFKLEQTANIADQVKQDDNLIYTTEITNEGDIAADVTITDDVPENAVVNRAYLEQNGQQTELTVNGQVISIPATIQAKEQVKLVIETTINTYLNNNTEISNTVTLNSRQVKKEQTSNTIKHKIVDEISGEPGGGDEPNPDPDPDNPGTNISINGFTWNDADKDGVKDSSEVNIPDIRVLLITGTGTILQETTSSSNGYYEFNEVENGNYRVIFEYDTSKYYLSPYKANGIDENSNSDVLEAEIEENGQRKKVAATEELTVEDSDLNNINAGFIEFSARKLNISKTITKVTVKTNKSTKTYNFDRKQIAKVEIASKEMANAQIEIEYTIDIQNQGETTETIQEIVDTPSSDLKLKDTSGNWYSKGNDIATNQLENTTIGAGETKSIKLTMTTTTGSQGEGKNVINKAEISNVQSENANLNIDINSENNTAQLIIGVKTGAVQITILIILILAILVLIARIIIKRRGGLRKNGK